MATTEELLEEILRVNIEFVPAGEDSGDPAMASEMADVTEEVGMALLTEEETEEDAAIESGKASNSSSDFD